MFEHRLGLALSKSVGEIRAMPYPEYRSWQIYYMLEPFGWHDNEYRTASTLAMIHNTSVSKKKDLKSVKDFMRDMESALLKELEARSLSAPDEDMTEQEKNRIRKEAIKAFGAIPR